MDRLGELLHKNEQFLQDEEIIIYVKDGEMIARCHNEEELCQVSGKVNEKLADFLDWLKDSNQY